MVKVLPKALQDNKKREENTFICQNKRDSQPNIWQAVDRPPPLRPQRVELIA